MKISYGIAHQDFSDKNGYGYAAKMMIRSLHRLGHDVEYLDATAPVQVWFGQPQFWTWHPNQYRIAYLPWESTGLPDGWADSMNEVDEVWTPSPIIATWFEEAGVKVPIKVYQHGIDPIWGAYERSWRPGKPFNVFHHGAESHRKNVDYVRKAFFEVFGESPDARLNFKMRMDGFNIKEAGRIKFINGQLELNDLIELYAEQHLMVYPSYGEGFGLTPLQAMGTAMPVLITKGWAPYEHLLGDDYLIKSELKPSPFPDVHPGYMWHPDYKDMLDKMEFIADNYRYHAQAALTIARRTHMLYDWEDHTRAAFAHLEN